MGIHRAKKGVRRVLIVRKGTLGDQVCAMPAMEAIKCYFPEADIDLLTQCGSSKHLSAEKYCPLFRRVYHFGDHRITDLLRILKNRGYDVVIEIPQDRDTWFTQLRNMIVFRFIGIEAGAGWAVSRIDALSKHSKARWRFPGEQERIRTIMQRYDLQIDTDKYTFKREDIRGLLFSRHLTDPHKNIVIAPGASQQKKKWALPKFRQVAINMISKGYSVIVLGDERDAAATADWSLDGITNLCGMLSVSQSAEMLRHCAITLCNDSGPMHLSYAVGTPVVALFSARNSREKWFPPAEGNMVLMNDHVSCAGCMDDYCGYNFCIQSFQPADICRLLEEQLVKRTL